MARPTVLVADDSETVRRVVALACSTDEITVIAVADGQAAIEAIAAQPPDLVLADINMPGRTGYDVAAFVNARPELAHVRVVLLAGMFEPADQDRARALGCADVLVKPLTPQHLLLRIRDLVARAPQAPEPVAPAAEPASAEDYFSRLDEAFRNLGRPMGRPAQPEPAGSAETAGTAETVPTLQQLLDRMPKEARDRLTPVPPVAGAKDDDAFVEAVARRVAERLAGDTDWLERLARRLGARDTSDDGH